MVHTLPPMSPFYVPPSHSLLQTNDIFGNHIHPASLTNLSQSMINDLIASGALPPTFISQSPTLLFDKTRG